MLAKEFRDSKDSKESKPLTSDSKELTKRSQKETKLSITEEGKASEGVEEEKNEPGSHQDALKVP